MNNTKRHYQYSLYNDNCGPFPHKSSKAKGKVIDELKNQFGSYLRTVHFKKDDKWVVLFNHDLNDIDDPETEEYVAEAS